MTAFATTAKRTAVLGVLALGAFGAFGTQAAQAQAHDYKAGALIIHHPWSRVTPGGAGIGVGFMTITNSGKSADRLLGASARIAKRVSVHSMTMIKGVMRMRAVKGGLEIKPGETVKLAPGGYHLMFMGLRRPIVKGKPFKATLRFQNAGEVAVGFKVEGIAAMSSGTMSSRDAAPAGMVPGDMMKHGAHATNGKRKMKMPMTGAMKPQ